MKLVVPMVFNSKEDLYKNIEDIKSELIDRAIVCIRGLDLSTDEQLQFTKDLGEIMLWTPNNSSSFNHEYFETHSSNSSVSGSKADQVILGWHFEHVDYDNYSPLVAGVWNMHKFDCDTDAGMTYFMDSREIYEALFSEEEKDFLRKSVASWSETYSDGKEFVNNAPVVGVHWLDGREQIRLEMHQLSSLELYTFDSEDPTQSQKDFFQDMVSKFVSEVYSNEDLRIVHKWSKGDILIPDLYALAHAVTGGFSPEERQFTGYWCYLNSPENLKTGEVHPSWTE